MRKIRWSVIMFVILMLNLTLLVMHRQPSALRRETVRGELYQFEADRSYVSGLTDLCVKDGKLYLLYDQISVLKVYSDRGDFLVAYAYYNTNGEGALYVDAEKVYLKDQNNNLYVFTQGQWTETIAYSDYGTYLEQLARFSPEEQKLTAEDGSRYYRRLGSVYQVTPEGERSVVIRAPFYTWIAQEHIPWILHFLLFVLLAVLVICEKRKEKKTKKA